METPKLDELIEMYKGYDSTNYLTDEEKEELNEFVAIKQALSQHDIIKNKVSVDAKHLLTAGWISVNEKKPNNKDMVLVSCEHGVTMAEYTKFDNGNEMWWAVLCIGTYEDGVNAKQVTHWMPLPCPPACTH